jgi:hypothetical protein
MGKQELSQPNPGLTSAAQFIESLCGGFIHRIPRGVRLPGSDSTRWDQVAHVMKEVERHSRRPDVRYSGAVIEFSIRNKPSPQRNRIVIYAHKADISLVELGLGEPALGGKAERLSLHPAPQHNQEISIFLKILALGIDADPIVNVEHRNQDD